MTQPSQPIADPVPSNGPKPFGPLVQAVAVLVGILLVAAVGIGLFKRSFDRRLIAGLIDKRVTEARRLVDTRSNPAAEDLLVDLVSFAPEARDRVARGFADWMVIMPRLEALLRASFDEPRRPNAPHSQAPYFRTEMELRSAQYEAVLSRLASPHAADEGFPRAAYQRFAAIECQQWGNLSRLPSFDQMPSGSSETFREVPEKSMLFGATPLGALRNRAEAVTSYHRGVLAFYQGRWREAERCLEEDWEKQDKRADAAYLLGALAEIQGERETARAWYAQALATGANHLRASRAYLRTTGH